MRFVRILALSFLIFLPPAAPLFAADGPNYFELKDAPTIDVDWSKSSTQAVTLHGDRRLTFANGTKGRRYLLVITQDATGSRRVVWPSSVRWPGGILPPSEDLLTTIANKTDYITFYFNGVTYDALAIARNY